VQYLTILRSWGVCNNNVDFTEPVDLDSQMGQI